MFNFFNKSEIISLITLQMNTSLKVKFWLKTILINTRP